MTSSIETERELFAVVKRERRARDRGDWDGLAAMYWPGAVVRVTWFEGSVADFIDGSRRSRAPGKPSGIHPIMPSWCEVNGDRALVESHGQIVIRPRLDDVQCDVTNWCRFFSRLERREGQWRLLTFDSVYIKDRLDPVVPGTQVDIDQEELARGRQSYQFLTYLNNRSGRTVPQDLPGDDAPEILEAFYADAREWLERGDAAVEGRWRRADAQVRA